MAHLRCCCGNTFARVADVGVGPLQACRPSVAYEPAAGSQWKDRGREVGIVMDKAKILVVEDEPKISDILRELLINLGYDIAATTSSGEDAIRKVGETQPDLVLMDIRLKGDMDGVDAAEHIHAHFNTPIVYLTAYMDESLINRVLLTEPFGYILKPFQVKELQTAIEIALYKHKMEKKLKDIMNLKVKDVMNKQVIYIKKDEYLLLAASLMKLKDIARLPVVDDKKRLIGILTKRDIFRALIGKYF